MNRYTAFVKSLGFQGVVFTAKIHKGQTVQLEYEHFDPQQVRARLGRSTKHRENRFVFVLSKTQAVRVNTEVRRVWLGNGKQAVKRFLESV